MKKYRCMNSRCKNFTRSTGASKYCPVCKGRTKKSDSDD